LETSQAGASLKPKRIILIRHGQSEGNIDKSVYTRKPDYALDLTELGQKQAIEVGRHLSDVLKLEACGLYVSPFYRARQTADEIEDFLLRVSFRIEYPTLREQEWSTCLRLTDDNKEVEEERDKIGPFYYRFENGESVADVFLRVSDFISTLHRDFEKKSFPENCIIVGHGMTNRVFLMRWFHMTVEEFELLRNPKNCEYYLLELQENGKYKLSKEPERYEKSYRIY
jgi:broad specificity phosphatase PhoE